MGLKIINAAIKQADLASMQDNLQKMFTQVSKELGNCHANLKFISEKEMQDLNQEFRGKNACTNVLAFPNDTFNEDKFLGDIAICFDYCKREALEQKKSIQDHITHMLLHALLHLMGYDHQTKDEAVKMEELEIEILTQHNIPNPYNLI